jgi:predicted nucleic acid-binding Zn ribbon protein
VKTTTPERVRRGRGAVPQGALDRRDRRSYVAPTMLRGRRRTLASTLADALARNRAAQPVALAAAFAEACGPALAREVSMRGVTRDGQLLVVVRSEAWAAQVREHASMLCELVNARLGRVVANGLDVHLASPER